MDKENIIYEKDDIRRVYWLMDLYLSGKIDAGTFGDEFYYSYDLEIVHDKLSELEKKCFANLSIVAGRFSEFESDHKNYPGAFFTEEQLKQKIIKTKKRLQDCRREPLAGA